MAEQDFKEDIQQEPIIRKFAERELYPRFYKSIQFTENMDDQYGGVDYVLDGQKHDIKAQTKSYLNSPTETFCLEIGAYNKDMEWKKGWFVRNLLTQFYDWLWIHEAKVVYHGDKKPSNQFVENPEDIYVAEFMSVDVRKVKAALMFQYGVTLDDLWEIACDMKNRYESTSHANKENVVEIHKGLKFVLSPWLKEKSINVVIKKEWYKQFAPLHAMYRRGYITNLKNDGVSERRCPKCGALLVPRKRRSDGNPFLGCRNFPNCNYTENISNR